MCPENEVTFRVTNQLIHKLEEGKFMVKEYQRPAADKTDHSAVSEKVWCVYAFLLVDTEKYKKYHFLQIKSRHQGGPCPQGT